MIAIILVNWNGHRDTIECLESLLRLADPNFVVLIVDNGSADGSVTALEAWAAAGEAAKPCGPAWSGLPKARLCQPHVTRIALNGSIVGLAVGTIAIVEANANLGFAGGNNLGMRLARQDPRISAFWLLNNDTVVAPDCLTRLKAVAAARLDAGLIGACIMHYDEPDLVAAVGGFFKPWQARGGHIGWRMRRDELPPTEVIERQMAYVVGASIFVPVAAYDAMGPMCEDYFLYFEEPDWAHHLPRHLCQTVAADALVYHKESASIGKSGAKRVSDTGLYYRYANLVRYMWRWHRAKMPIAFMRIAYEGARYIVKGDWRAAGILRRAAADGFRSIFDHDSWERRQLREGRGREASLQAGRRQDNARIVT